MCGEVGPPSVCPAHQADALGALQHSQIKLLRHFKHHENIIAVKDIITFPPNTIDFKDVYIITNLMESDLDRIISSSQPLSDQHFQYFLYQVGSERFFSFKVFRNTIAI